MLLSNRMKSYRHIIIILAYLSLGSWQTFAQQTQDTNNCGIDFTSVKGGYQWYNNIFPTKLITVAEKNLKTYCCTYESESISNTQIEKCKNDISDYYVESPRLYDHLIDVGMRYLDGEEKLQYNNNNEVTLDKKGSERRSFVTKYGDAPNGKIPLELQSTYSQYRGNMTEDFDLLENTTACEDRKQAFQEYNNNRDSLSLAKKYFILCEISSCMVDGTKNNRIESCQSLVANRISQERNYVQWLLLYQSTLALATNFDAYAIADLNHNRFSVLLEKIVMMSKGLWFVNNKVNEMTKMCSA